MSDPIPARLYSVGFGRAKARNSQTGEIKPPGVGLSIDFPALPDVLSFAREAEYQVPKTQFHPDGLVHIFQSNTLLNVPVSFKLHAADDTYCKSAVDLLWMAAALQAFTLPMTRGKTRLPGVPVNENGFVTPRTESGLVSLGAGALESPAGQDGLRFPTVAILDLIMATDGSTNPTTQTGVRMAGYVKQAEAKMFGPWLQVESGGAGTRNLPSRAEFNFTFVHAPSYRNYFRSVAPVNASAESSAAALSTQQSDSIAARIPDYFGQGYAEYVRDYFYNTLALFDSAALTNADAVVLDVGANRLNAGR